MKAILILCSLVISLSQVSMSYSSESTSSEIKVGGGGDDLKVMNQLLISENEISSEIDSRKKAKPTQYMNYLLEQFEDYLDSSSLPSESEKNSVSSAREIKMNNQIFIKPSERIFHAWLPMEIIQPTHSYSKTTVTFQQSMLRHEYGNFSSCHIVLTLRDDVTESELPANTLIQLYTFHNESVSSQHQKVSKNKKFYAFDITEFIKSRLQHNPSVPNLVNISFQAISIQRRGRLLDFSRLFDVQVDFPTIVYFYKGFVPAESLSKTHRRVRRANFGTLRDVYSFARPKSLCQRREFLVTPEQINLLNVVGPKLLDLGYCSGQCIYPLHDSYFNYTMHTFLLDRFRLGNKAVPSDMPKSTCVPISYKSISVLDHVPPDNIKAEVIKDISVQSCGCR